MCICACVHVCACETKQRCSRIAYIISLLYVYMCIRVCACKTKQRCSLMKLTVYPGYWHMHVFVCVCLYVYYFVCMRVCVCVYQKEKNTWNDSRASPVPECFSLHQNAYVSNPCPPIWSPSHLASLFPAIQVSLWAPHGWCLTAGIWTWTLFSFVAAFAWCQEARLYGMFLVLVFLFKIPRALMRLRPGHCAIEVTWVYGRDIRIEESRAGIECDTLPSKNGNQGQKRFF